MISEKDFLEKMGAEPSGSFMGVISQCLKNKGCVALPIRGKTAADIMSVPAVTVEPERPLAQPRNLMGGHMISAVIGVAAFKLLGASMPLAAAVAVATAILAMHATKTLHPPGGATALIAVIGSSKIHALGFWYVLVPASLGAVVMLAVALLVNNLTPRRRYPEFWL